MGLSAVGKTLGQFCRRWLRYGLLLGLSLVLGMLGHPSRATELRSPAIAPPPDAAWVGQSLRQQGQDLYNAHQYEDAAVILEQAVRSTSHPLEQVQLWRNLALVYHQLAQWSNANQAINSALRQLNTLNSADTLEVLASVLDVQGTVQLAQGQPEFALASWERAAEIYQQLGDQEKSLQNQINQAQALQQLGFYRRSLDLLTAVLSELDSQPDSIQKAVALQALGDALQFVGDLDQAKSALEQSLAIAQSLNISEVVDTIQLSLGNVLHAQGNSAEALQVYHGIVTQSASSFNRIQAQLNILAVWIEIGQTQEVQAQWSAIATDLDYIPPSQTALFARINFAQHLIQLGVAQNPSPADIAEILTSAIVQAQELGDRRAESYAVGTLGMLYEKTGQWQDAQGLTEQALNLIQDQSVPDIAYRWHWQLGRLLRQQAVQTQSPDYDHQAIAAYTESLNALKLLRSDLIAINPAVQVSFQESVEPLHREFVSVLLDPVQGSPSANDLETARNVIESLQLAELDNFFREACLDTHPVNIDQLDPTSAIIYPILLLDRLEIIVRLPQQELRHYTVSVSQSQVEQVVDQLSNFLVLRVGQEFLPSARQLYEWILRPVEADLATTSVSNLVFVLDGVLRNVPMGVLHDGQQFLIESYSVALAPGLQLVDPYPLLDRQLSALTAGISESRQGFSPLPNVVPELEQIQTAIPSQVLLNQDFTLDTFQKAIDESSTPIVHLATHGRFSSNKNDTYVLAWDDRLDINRLNRLLQTAELNQSKPIELLVLSACQTARGDKQAALGLAGMAVRAGARSTIATLWSVNDEATAILMSHFYRELRNSPISKAEALRQAQLVVLNTPEFRRHPYYWSPYVLLGNWL